MLEPTWTNINQQSICHEGLTQVVQDRASPCWLCVSWAQDLNRTNLLRPCGKIRRREPWIRFSAVFFFAKSPAGQSHTAEDIKNYKDMPRVICQKCDCQSLVPWHGGEARFGASRENVKRWFERPSHAKNQATVASFWGTFVFRSFFPVVHLPRTFKNILCLDNLPGKFPNEATCDPKRVHPWAKSSKISGPHGITASDGGQM